MKVPVVFGLIADFALSRGATNIKDMPGGQWIGKVDGNWTVAVNATNENRSVEPPGCMAVLASPWSAAIWWNGWLAGLVDAAGGTIAAHPLGANEDRLIEALKVATGLPEEKQ